MKQAGERWLLTGERNSGKTRALELLLAWLTKNRPALQVAGLISPGVYQDGKKIAIDIVDLRTDDHRRLADPKESAQQGLSTKRWFFYTDIIAWGNRKLREINSCDIFIIDELGPLEFEREDGFQIALPLMDRAAFRLGFAVVRPSLLDRAESRWKPERILDIPEWGGPEPASRQMITHVNNQFPEEEYT
ncbi:MAG: nucleoside-triphosphatase [Anaerolineales bacterium]